MVIIINKYIGVQIKIIINNLTSININLEIGKQNQG